MIRASALYLVIVIALVVGLVCSSLVVISYFYRAEYQKKFRYDRLSHNLLSGINLLLASPDSSYLRETRMSLFSTNTDSIVLQRKAWGIFDVGAVQAFLQKDTIYKAFSIASAIDSGKWAALYIADDDRPLSVSGRTRIEGNAYLPKAGIQTAYVDGKAYEGDKRLVIGKKLISKKKLPSLDSTQLKLLDRYFSVKGNKLSADSLSRSFLKSTKIVDLESRPYTLDKIYLKGNILLHSDTTLTIDSSARLDNVLVFAKTIIVREGFKGACQLFASDSIIVGKSCKFNYPSCLGVIRSKTAKFSRQVKIAIGEASTVNGAIFTWEPAAGGLKPLISLSKNDTIKGQIYSQDALALKDNCVVFGSIFSVRFLYQNSFTLYENYLINLQLNSNELSPYYLCGGLLPAASKKKRILQWLERN